MDFRFNPFFYSQARQVWRMEVYETGGTWQQNRMGFIHVEKKEVMEIITAVMPTMKGFSDFEFLISELRKQKLEGWTHAIN